MSGLPPLMPGWTEHVAPQGQQYWYNAALQQSTYTRPTLQPPAGFATHAGSIPVYSGPPPPLSSSIVPYSSSQASNPPSDGSNILAGPSKVKAKKEKPSKKEAIPGADGWLRVTTTLGNIFYTHVESKRSEWTVPEDIKEQVEFMQEEERRLKAVEEEEKRLAKEQLEEEQRQVREEERRKKMKEDERERKKRQEELELREEAVRRQREERDRIREERLRILQEQGKRKRQDENGDREGIDQQEEGEKDKKARLEEGSDDEEAWQREMAAEMAAEAEAGEANSPSPVESDVPPAIPSVETSKLDLSLEEGKALFMHMLTSLNETSNEVNPMAPWDRELPKFIHQRDYTVLNSVRDRQDAFNEWCKLRLREKRSKGAKQSTSTQKQDEKKDVSELESNGHEKGEESASDAATMYRNLLESEVKSTRTKWEDFKKSWRKNRSFFAFGRDDREREKVFRNWLKELGEKKQRAAEQADNDFIALLEEFLTSEDRVESGAVSEDVQSKWTKAKRAPGLTGDARYDAVGSSSRRAELFGEWATGQRRPGNQTKIESEGSEDAQESDKTAKYSSNRALQEREEAVQRQRREMESQKRKAFGQATREESLTSFRQLLVDAIRDPLMSMSQAMDVLSSDGRFNAPGIRPNEKEYLIEQHFDSLNAKRLRELQDVFEKYAPALDVDAEVALPLIKDDDEIERRHLMELRVLKIGKVDLKDLFHDWRKEKEQEASTAFQQMLKENAFLNFWGRLRQENEQRQQAAKEGGVAGSGGRQGEDEEDDDEPDLLQMASNVDLEEVHSILRNDQRYRAFRHRPQLREEWIRNHLQTMTIPKKTIYQRDE